MIKYLAHLFLEIIRKFNILTHLRIYSDFRNLRDKHYFYENLNKIKLIIARIRERFTINEIITEKRVK